ncbi:MAG: ATP synthase F1 subunit epsilon [Bdellovibrionales bacterium]|nr:ATP synthase F1 subunit epsilon [Bdellovibrionales bacterium]
MKSFSLSVFAPERRLTQDEQVQSFVVTTTKGEIEILPGHANMISALDAGHFVYTPVDKSPVRGVISSGFVNVEDGAVKVIAETVELAHEIDLSRAKAAQMKAEKMLADASLDSSAFRKYQLKLQRALIRQSLGGK